MNLYEKNKKLLEKYNSYDSSLEHDACGVGLITSLDGKKRFYLKSSKKLYLAHLAGKELGEKIKKRSKNLYKKKR